MRDELKERLRGRLPFSVDKLHNLHTRTFFAFTVDLSVLDPLAHPVIFLV